MTLGGLVTLTAALMAQAGSASRPAAPPSSSASAQEATGRKPAPRPAPAPKSADEVLEKALADVPPVETPPPPPPFRWQLKNVIDEIEMPGLQESNGIPVKMHQVRIKGNLRDVVEDAVDQFEKQGLYMEPVTKQPQLTAETQVTALDPYRFISYTVLIKPHKPSGTCEVILAEANIALGAEQQARLKASGDFAPLHPSARNVLRGSAAELRTLSYATLVSEADVRKWYGDEMKKRGYEVGESTFTRGNEKIRMTLRKKDGELTVLLMQHNAVE